MGGRGGGGGGGGGLYVCVQFKLCGLAKRVNLSILIFCTSLSRFFFLFFFFFFYVDFV